MNHAVGALRALSLKILTPTAIIAAITISKALHYIKKEDKRMRILRKQLQPQEELSPIVHGKTRNFFKVYHHGMISFPKKTYHEMKTYTIPTSL